MLKFKSIKNQRNPAKSREKHNKYSRGKFKKEKGMSYYKEALRIYFKFLRFLVPYWKIGAAACILMVISALLQLPAPLLTKYLIDTIVPSKDLLLLNIFALVLVGVIIVSNLISYYQSYLLITYRKKIETHIRSLLFERIMAARIIDLERTKTGYTASRIDNDVDAVGNLFMETILNLIINFLTFLVGVSLCFYLNTGLAVVSLLSLPLFLITFHVFSKKMNHLTRIRQEKWALLRGDTVEYISQVRIIKAFNRIKDIFHLYMVSLKDAIQSDRKLELYSVLAGIVVGIIGVILPFFVLWYGVREIIMGRFTIGGFIAFNTCIGYLYNPIRNFVSLNIDIHGAIAAAGRIFEILEYKDEKALFGNKEIESIDSLQLQNVSFYYEEGEDGEKRGIENVSLELKRGQNFAVVGETGKGKSTIARLIVGFDLPCQGELLLNGVNYNVFKLESIRDRIGYVPQEPELLMGSIKNNITFFSRAYDDSFLKQVIQWCGLEHTINRLPGGLETGVYEKGFGLSGGEKQRIAIARAIIKKPDLLIFDEVSSAIDPETETHLITNLLKLPWKPAVIFITHRYHHLDKFDKVINLQAVEKT